MATDCTGEQVWSGLSSEGQPPESKGIEAKRVCCNPDRLSFAMKQLGLSCDQLAARSGVNSRTIKGWLVSSRASREHLEKVAAKLGCSLEFLAGNEEMVSRSNVRCIAGKWKISGADIMDGNCAGQEGAGGKIEGFLEIVQDESVPTIIRARGHDQDGDLVELLGEIEGSDYISGRYTVDNPRMEIFGTFFVHIVNDGRHIRGKYLGREKGTATPDNVVAGTLELERVD